MNRQRLIALRTCAGLSARSQLKSLVNIDTSTAASGRVLIWIVEHRFES